MSTTAQLTHAFGINEAHPRRPRRLAMASWWRWLVVGRSARRTLPFQITYIGDVPLTVSGPATGAAYRFDGKGTTLPVDGRDAAALLVREDLRMLEALVVRML